MIRRFISWLVIPMCVLVFAGCNDEAVAGSSDIQIRQVGVLLPAQRRDLPQEDGFSSSLSAAFLEALPEQAVLEPFGFSGDFYMALKDQTCVELILAEPVELSFTDSEDGRISFEGCDRLLAAFSEGETRLYVSVGGVYQQQRIAGMRGEGLLELLSQNKKGLQYGEISIYKYGVDPLLCVKNTAERTMVMEMMSTARQESGKTAEGKVDFTLYMANGTEADTADFYCSGNKLYFSRFDEPDVLYTVADEYADRFFTMTEACGVGREILTAG